MNRLAQWMSTYLRGFVQRGQVRTSLHLDDRIALTIEQVQILTILEKCAFDGDCALIVQNRAALEKWRYVRVIKRVVEAVGVTGVLIAHEVRDQHVAHV